MKAVIAFSMLILIVAQFALADAQQAEEELGESSINPDSIFWGIENALDKLSLALTFNDKSRAERGLEIARERLLEFKLMAEKGKIRDAEKAKFSHDEFLDEVKAAAKEIEDENKTIEIKEQIEIEKEIEKFENISDDVGARIKVRIETLSGLSAEQKALIEQLIASMQNQTGSLKVEIRQNKERIKIEIKRTTGKPDIEIEEETEELEDELNLTGTKREKALGEISDAEEDIAELKSDIAAYNLTDNALLVLLNNSGAKLAEARKAFNMSNFGEAYGLANAAERLADNARGMIDRLTGRDEGGEENRNGMVCIQVITPARNERTGECRDFPTPCDVPSGWKRIDSCGSTSGGRSGEKCCMPAKGMCEEIDSERECVGGQVVDCGSMICNPQVV